MSERALTVPGVTSWYADRQRSLKHGSDSRLSLASILKAVVFQLCWALQIRLSPMKWPGSRVPRGYMSLEGSDFDDRLEEHHMPLSY